MNYNVTKSPFGNYLSTQDYVRIQVTQLCFMLDAILKLPAEDESSSYISSNENLEVTSVISAQPTDEMEANFILALYCSLGAPLEDDSRLVFDDFVKNITGFLKVNDTPAKRATLSKS
jgi:hypothetical protein